MRAGSIFILDPLHLDAPNLQSLSALGTLQRHSTHSRQTPEEKFTVASARSVKQAKHVPEQESPLNIIYPCISKGAVERERFCSASWAGQKCCPTAALGAASSRWPPLLCIPPDMSTSVCGKNGWIDKPK